ncbi:uncharacterized protein CBL_13518 [Carabus blaptoides fortunei]
MLATSNGGIGNRVPRPDSSMVMEPRVDQNRMQQQQFPLNASNLNSSKHSLCGGVGNSLLSPAPAKSLNGGLNISRSRNQLGGGALTAGKSSTSIVALGYRAGKQIGVKEMLVSLGLLCLVSLLLALLSLIFLLKISPVTAHDIRELLRAEQLTVITAEEYAVVYEVTLALCALTLSLNLCCLLVCAIQFLFAVKLVKSPHGGSDRTSKYLQKSSVSRVCAVGGFFISIPVFLTGIILYTFIQFHSTPAIVTSVFIGLGIIFCGCAMVHNVFIWQREKTNAVKELALQQQHEQIAQQQHFSSHNSIAAVTGAATSPLSNSVIGSLASPISSSAILGATSNGSVINNNQSHISYNHSFVHSPSAQQLHSSTTAAGSFVVRPSTTTPPTGDTVGKLTQSHPREASGSVSPGMPNATLDLSSVATTNSPHELSTLV